MRPFRSVALLCLGVAALVAGLIIGAHGDEPTAVSLAELWWPAAVALVGVAFLVADVVQQHRARQRQEAADAARLEVAGGMSVTDGSSEAHS